MAKKTKGEIVSDILGSATYSTMRLSEVYSAMESYSQSQNEDLLKEIERLKESLRSLRNGLFKDEQAVNDFIDKALSRS